MFSLGDDGPVKPDELTDDQLEGTNGGSCFLPL